MPQPQPTPPPQPSGQGDGGGWTTPRLALLGAFVLVALLLGLLVGDQLGSSNSKGGTTTVITKKNPSTETQTQTTTSVSTVTQPASTVTSTDTVTTTVTSGGG